MFYPLSEKITENIRVFGEHDAAKLLSRRVPFDVYYRARFNREPRM